MSKRKSDSEELQVVPPPVSSSASSVDFNESVNDKSEDAPNSKRLCAHSLVRTVTMKQSGGHDHSLDQAFRELIANAYDDHVHANPKDVEFNEEHVNDSTPHVSVWNKESAITRKHFSIEKSNKIEFKLRPDHFVSCIGCFGVGMAKAAAKLALLDCALIFHTQQSTIVVASSVGTEEDHSNRCNTAIVSVIPQLALWDFDLHTHHIAKKSASTGNPDDTPTQPVEAASPDSQEKDVNERENPLTFREYHTQAAASFNGTKLFILFPTPTEYVEAWTRARMSFLHYYNAFPILEIYCSNTGKAKSRIPALQVYEKVPVPAELFATSDPETTAANFIFVNGMAYRVDASSELYFSFNFILQPTSHNSEILAVTKFRAQLSSKRQLIGWDIVANLLNHLFSGPKMHPNADTLQTALTSHGIVDVLAEADACQNLDPAYNIAQALARLRTKFEPRPSALILARPAVVDFLHAYKMPSPSKFADLTSTVNSVIQVFTRLHQEIEAELVKRIKPKADAVAQRELEEVAEEAQRDARNAPDQDGEDMEDADAPVPTRPVEVQLVAKIPVITNRKSNQQMLDKLAYNLVRVPPAKQEKILAKLQHIVDVNARAVAKSQLPAKVTINVRTTGKLSANMMPTLEDAKKRAPELTWSHAADKDHFSNFTHTDVPFNVVKTLLQQGSGAAFKQSFVTDMADPNLQALERGARRALLYALCHSMQAIDRGAVNVVLSHRSHPLLTTPHIDSGSAIDDAVPELEVPWKGIRLPSEHSVANKPTTGIFLSEETLVGCIREVARVGLQSPRASVPGVTSAECQALQTMLFHVVDREFNTSLSSSPGLPASFEIVRPLVPTASSFHVLVLIDAWGREFGGVPVFNMALCKALADGCRWKGEEIWVTCVAVKGVSETANEQLPARLRVIEPPHPVGVDDVLARLYLFSRTDLRRHPDWPTPVHLVVGHDRFTGQVVANVASRFQALSTVFAHTNPLAIATTKADEYEYCAQRKDDMLQAALKHVDQAFGCGNAYDRFKSLIFKHQDHEMLDFQAGYITPSANAHRLSWQVENDLMKKAGSPLRLVVVGRFQDKLKNSVQVHPIVNALTEKNKQYSLTLIGMDPSSKSSDIDAVIAGSGSMYNAFVQPYVNDETKFFETIRSGLCLLMPSLVESYGLVAAEALGIGLPIIVSRVSGLGQHLVHLSTCPQDWAPTSGVGTWDTAEVGKRFEFLVSKIVLDVSRKTEDNPSKVEFPVDIWAASVEWIKQETIEQKMNQWVDLLKAALGSWVASVQQQFCDKMANSALETHQQQLSVRRAWMDY